MVFNIRLLPIFMLRLPIFSAVSIIKISATYLLEHSRSLQLIFHFERWVSFLVASSVSVPWFGGYLYFNWLWRYHYVCCIANDIYSCVYLNLYFCVYYYYIPEGLRTICVYLKVYLYLCIPESLYIFVCTWKSMYICVYLCIPEG